MASWSDFGNPGALRDEARRLRAQADRVRQVAGWADRQLTSMTFEGPAARRFRASSEGDRRQALRCAEQIDALAQLLDQGARTSEVQRAGYQRQLAAEERRRREAAARRASGGGGGW